MCTALPLSRSQLDEGRPPSLPCQHHAQSRWSWFKAYLSLLDKKDSKKKKCFIAFPLRTVPWCHHRDQSCPPTKSWPCGESSCNPAGSIRSFFVRLVLVVHNFVFCILWWVNFQSSWLHPNTSVSVSSWSIQRAKDRYKDHLDGQLQPFLFVSQITHFTMANIYMGMGNLEKAKQFYMVRFNPESAL